MRRWRGGSPRRWPPSSVRSASRSTTRRCSTSTPIRRTPSSATGPWPRMPTASPGSARRSSRRLQNNGVAACGKHFPGHGDTSVDSHLDLPLIEHPPDRIRRVELVPVPRSDQGRRGVHHDRARARAVSGRGETRDALAAHRPGHAARRVGIPRRDSQRRPGDEGDRQVVHRCPMPRCRRLRPVATACLICSGDVDVQAATLEALVRAVEQDVIPYKRLEDALKRNRAAKERFLAAPVAHESARPASPRARLRRTPAHRGRDVPVCLMRKPRPLKSGDRIAIVAPASPFARDEFDRGVAELTAARV